MPIYRINFKLYRNGITRDLTMDYGDFSMRGKLVKLDIYDIGENKTDAVIAPVLTIILFSGFMFSWYQSI